MKHIKLLFALAAAALLFTNCNNDGGFEDSPYDLTSGGVIILDEGMLGVGNAEISYYTPGDGQVINNVFEKANDADFGDAAASLTFYGGRMYATLSASDKIYVIDPKTSLMTGKLTDINSPRDMYFFSSTKAYVSSLYANEIYIVNPSTMTVTGTVVLGAGNSAETLISHGGYIYTNCWNNNSRLLLKIDPAKDQVVATLEVGYQPSKMTIDKNGSLWVFTDGGWTSDWTTHLETPALHRVGTIDFTVENSWPMGDWDWVTAAAMNAAGDKLYYVNTDVYEIPVSGSYADARAVIPADGRSFYGLGVLPNNDLYVSDPLDYQQAGDVFRYNSSFGLVASFKVGVAPAKFYTYR
ncbi:MAG: hypothetical protein LBU80_07870 [Rikenellaceae bacterium]|jgi:glutamine cyclotransferase|nr:hypothetical protein [Rikenellaceae bacterium]